LIWRTASSTPHFDDATFDRTAAAYDDPDHVAIVIHNYHWRPSRDSGAPRCDCLERRLSWASMVAVPSSTIASDYDGAASHGKGCAKPSTGRNAHRVLQGIRHNVPREALEGFASALVDVDRLGRAQRRFRPRVARGAPTGTM
jgi:hypothetical protein